LIRSVARPIGAPGAGDAGTADRPAGGGEQGQAQPGRAGPADHHSARAEAAQPARARAQRPAWGAIGWCEATIGRAGHPMRPTSRPRPALPLAPAQPAPDLIGGRTRLQADEGLGRAGGAAGRPPIVPGRGSTRRDGREEEDGPATFAKEPALSPCAQGQANQLARALDRPGGLAPDPDRSAVKARKAMPSCDTSPKRHDNDAPLPIVHSVGA
jgi:hypothetical protein